MTSASGLDTRVVVQRPEGFRLDLALSIAPGHTVALLGPNGSGKSTAVAAIAGLIPIDEGRISLAGTVLDDPEEGVFVAPEKRRIGVVFQDYLLFPHLTVLENVAFGLRSHGLTRDTTVTRSRALMARLGLEALERRKPADLSGGQAQRVALARALVTEPELLLLDEPLAALDVTTRTELRYVLQEHLDAFLGPRLLITHDPTEAFLLADQIQIIEDGTITQTGSADEIRLRPQTPYAADLAGSNLIAGVASDRVVDVDGHLIHLADDLTQGPVLLTIHPHAVSIHSTQPGGSPRNTWSTSVERVEDLGTRVRLRTGPPLPLTAELTEAARAELRIRPGSEVWVAIKATEIGVQAHTAGLRSQVGDPQRARG